MTYYKSLDFLPWKILIEIVKTNNVLLLSKSEKEPEEFSKEEIEKFTAVWDDLYQKYQELDPKNEAGKILKIQREVQHFKAKYKLINIYCQILKFDWDDEAATQLRGFGYKLRDDENYYPDIERIERESEGLLVKAEKYESMLPKQDDEETNAEVSTDEVLASYSAILGIDFDYNTVSVTKVIALQNQVSNKIKMLQKQNPKK